RRYVREALALEGAHRSAATRPVHEAHDGHAEIVCEPLGIKKLLVHAGIGRAATNREIVADDRDRARVDGSVSRHLVRRDEVDEFGSFITRRAGYRADFAK